MRWRMGTAMLSLAGLFVSAYLFLYKAGYIGTLACGAGGCETVQLSPQSSFLGIDVALIGMVGYTVLLGVSLAGLQLRYAAARGPSVALVTLSGGALAFTLYLKYLELFVIHAICRWCVVSAVLILAIFVLSLLDLRRTKVSV